MKNIIHILFAILVLAGCKKDDSSDPQTPANTTYKVTYSGNGNTGGTVPVDPNNYTSDSNATVLGNTGNLVKTGYTFVGWNTAANGTGADRLPGSTITITNSNITLYAKWSQNSPGTTFTVTYNGNGNTSGTAPVDFTAYSPGSQVTIKGNTGGLVKNGNAFINWNTAQNGSGQSYSPNTQIAIQGNLTLYAIYAGNPTTSGKYYGFLPSGQVRMKNTLTSPWVDADLNNTFGSTLAAVVWNGSQYVGFLPSGQARRKNTLTSPWVDADLNNTFGSTLAAVVWNGSQYVGFLPSGQARRKNSLTSPWVDADLNNTFGSTLAAVVWDGTQYVGFLPSGQARKKSSLTSPWVDADLNNTFGSTLKAVVWNGTQYVGFLPSGQARRKNSLTSPWVDADLNNTFGSTLAAVVYH